MACDCHLLEDLVCLRITYVFGPANIPDFCFSLDFSKISLLDFSCSTKMYDFLVSCYCLPGLALNSWHDWFFHTCTTVLIGLLFVISGFGGSLLSALFIQSNISVGASGALFGLLGGMLSELITNWTIYENKVLIKSLIWNCKCFKRKEHLKSNLLTIMILFSCEASSTPHPCDHHCYQSSSGNSPTCGQFCSYWRLSYRISSWICVFDTSPVWMG